jgi:hypothetical protein
MLKMTEKGNWDSTGFDQLMKDSQKELVDLNNQLQNLMVRFCLRALRVYQAARPEPLKATEIAYLTKNELNNAIADLSMQSNMEAIAKIVKEEWEKQQNPIV